MSRRDARKAITIHLPDELRKRLVERTQARLPLAYLVRQALRQALDVGEGWERVVEPGYARPILVQLSTEERARLIMWTSKHDITDEVAILSLVSTTI